MATVRQKWHVDSNTPLTTITNYNYMSQIRQEKSNFILFLKKPKLSTSVCCGLGFSSRDNKIFLVKNKKTNIL